MGPSLVYLIRFSPARINYVWIQNRITLQNDVCHYEKVLEYTRLNMFEFLKMYATKIIV